MMILSLGTIYWDVVSQYILFTVDKKSYLLLYWLD